MKSFRNSVRFFVVLSLFTVSWLGLSYAQQAPAGPVRYSPIKFIDITGKVIGCADAGQCPLVGQAGGNGTLPASCEQKDVSKHTQLQVSGGTAQDSKEVERQDDFENTFIHAFADGQTTGSYTVFAQADKIETNLTFVSDNLVMAEMKPAGCNPDSLVSACAQTSSSAEGFFVVPFTIAKACTAKATAMVSGSDDYDGCGDQNPSGATVSWSIVEADTGNIMVSDDVTGYVVKHKEKVLLTGDYILYVTVKRTGVGASTGASCSDTPNEVECKQKDALNVKVKFILPNTTTV